MKTARVTKLANQAGRDIARWYLSPTGVLAAIAGAVVVLVALFADPQWALVLAVAVAALLGPLLVVGLAGKMANLQRSSDEKIHGVIEQAELLRSDQRMTARRLRKSRQGTRRRLRRLDGGQAEYSDRLTVLTDQVAETSERSATIGGAVADLEIQVPSLTADLRELTADLRELTTTQNESLEKVADIRASLDQFGSSETTESIRLRELQAQTDQLTETVEVLRAELEQERSALISDGSAAHFYLLPGYRRRLTLISDFDDLGNEDEWQREVYDYARGVAVQSGAKTIGDFGCGSAFKLLSRFAEFETTGIDRGPIVEHLRSSHPDRNWVESGELHPELFDTFDVIIASDVIEHLEQPDTLLDALSRSQATDFILSTPARELLVASGHRPYGPPANPHHYLEWSFDEFRTFVEPYLEVVDHHISNAGQATQLLHARRRT